ncbi:hypothetical protein [Labilibaculum filiforme]|jgi:hypothetical protein|uniref:hypothetical protein n=1 Tax=Labilibaculum filiforme TaxID=1940526 RepID=UPI0015D63056|nr:hypothetical protein [Labilibaculum filiforme]
MNNSLINILVEPIDILQEELKQIKGGNYSEPISCNPTGKAKCKKPGEDNSQTKYISVW